MVIAMLVVLASLGPILSPVTGRRTGPWLGPGPSSGPILRHLTKDTEPLVLSSKEEALTVSKAQLDHCLNNKLAELLERYLCMVSLPS